jgi:hypothetical protein
MLFFFAEKSFCPSPNPKAGGPPLVGSPRLFIQYIRSYLPYLKAVLSIRNLRTRHAVMKGTQSQVSHYLLFVFSCCVFLRRNTSVTPLSAQPKTQVTPRSAHFCCSN